MSDHDLHGAFNLSDPSDKSVLQEHAESHPNLDLDSYDVFLVMASAGKDSLACLLHLIELGVPRHKIELWHHDVDGFEGGGKRLMDWPVTSSYCMALANAFSLPIFYSWREGGILGEMLRENAPSRDVLFQTPDGLRRAVSKQDCLGTRLKFPQQSGSMSTRWCSSVNKISVAARAITGQSRFTNVRTIVITGERAQESAARSKYAVFEDHRTHTKTRTVHHWRPVLHWDSERVWKTIERHRIRAHPAYYIGFGRTSCLQCVFSSPNQWATVRQIAPFQFNEAVGLEKRFKVTLRRDGPLTNAADRGTSLNPSAELIALAMSETYTLPIRLADHEEWQLPIGAHGETCGPT